MENIAAQMIAIIHRYVAPFSPNSENPEFSRCFVVRMITNKKKQKQKNNERCSARFT